MKGDIKKCPVCGELFKMVNANQCVCPDKACKKAWYRRFKKNPQYGPQCVPKYGDRDEFTETTRESIVDFMEHRGLAVIEVAKILNRTLDAVQGQVDDMKASGEYDRIWKRLQAVRNSNAEMQQMSSLRRSFSTGDTKRNIKMHCDI